VVKKVVFLMLGVWLCGAFTPLSAEEPAAQVMLVAANILPESALDVQVFRGSDPTGSGNAEFDWTLDWGEMQFGDLGPADPNDAHSAQASPWIFMAYCVCENNNGIQYFVKYDGAPLMLEDGSASLPNDAWVVSVGAQTGDPYFNTRNTAGLMAGRISGADTNKILYTSTSDGRTDVFRVYFSIVGDPRLAVRGSNSALIPPSQKPGLYKGTVRLTMYN
jgi:hypothetical protein